MIGLYTVRSKETITKEENKNYRKTYDALLPEINANTEKYHKGKFKIRVLKKDSTTVSATIKAERVV